MSQAQLWEARRLRNRLVTLKLTVGLLVGAGVVVALLLEAPLPGLLIALGGLAVLGAVSSTGKQLRAAEHAIRIQQAAARPSGVEPAPLGYTQPSDHAQRARKNRRLMLVAGLLMVASGASLLIGLDTPWAGLLMLAAGGMYLIGGLTIGRRHPTTRDHS